jgi:predicted kinase
MIIIICGLPGVGKSTLAKELAPLINATILSTDKIRKELIPKPLYGRRERRLIYEVLIILSKYLSNANVEKMIIQMLISQFTRK